MKNLFLSFLIAMPTTQVWASAVCRSGDEIVTINDSRSITVLGLSDKGISDGTYGCIVTFTGPGFFSVQTSMQCQKVNVPGEVILGWMIEGLGGMGQHTASVALYVRNGTKVFEAGCARN